MKKKTKPDAVAPPEWLNEEAKQEWARVVVDGFVPASAADRTVLASYCQSYARWAQAERILEEHGTEIVIRDDKGVVKNVLVSPQVGISAKALDRMLKAASQLGVRSNLETSRSNTAPASGKSIAGEWFGEIN